MAATLQRRLASTFKAMLRQFPGVPITYRIFAQQLASVTTGTRSDLYRDVPIRGAMQQPVTVHDLVFGTSVVQIGDVKFTFAYADLTPYVQYAYKQMLSTSDLVVDAGGVVWRVTHTEITANGGIITVYARRAT